MIGKALSGKLFCTCTGLVPSKNTAKIQVCLVKCGVLFLNNLKDLDPSYKMDPDLEDCFGRENPCFIIEEIGLSLYDFLTTVQATLCGSYLGC